MSRTRASSLLSIAVTGDEPPSEFRIFAKGPNETKKGTFLFDEAAANSVMAEYAAHGIDLMIDYDHASLAGLSLDPAQSGKAAGWFNLAVRNGELWAINVRWCPPAAEALCAKQWRFMSPAFQTEDGPNGTPRICAVLNVALTNLPATRNLEPLMAASRSELSSLITTLGGSMDPKLIQEALDALIAGDDAKCAELLKSLVAAAAGADPDASTEDAPPPAGDGGADEAQEMGAAPPPPAKEDKQAVAASISQMLRMTGATTLVGLSEKVTALVAMAAEHEKNVAAVAKDRAAIELGKRKENAAKLVALGAETPHTSGLSKGKIVKRLLDEPLDEQTARVASLLAAKGGKLPSAPMPPVNGEYAPGAHVQLSADQMKICKETGCDPAVFASLIAQRDSVHATGGK